MYQLGLSQWKLNSNVQVGKNILEICEACDER